MAVAAGLAIPVLLGAAGLAVEYGQIMFVRAEAQRTADLASHAGAVAYVQTGSSDAMLAAARGVARLNGFGDDEIVVVLDGGHATDGAVRATITTPRPLFLPRLVGGDRSVDVVASAVAGATAGEPACVQALDPDGAGIILSGGTVMRADECAVASNAGVAAPCGTSILTKSLSYQSGPHPLPEWCETIRAPDGTAARITRGDTTDPLQGSAILAQAADWMAETAALVAPSDIVGAAGPDINFGWNQSATQAQAAAVGCSAALGSSTWTFTCPGKTTVTLGNVTLGGGLTLHFNPGASSNVTYNLSGRIYNGGARMNFAGGTYNVAQGLSTNGGSITSFGAGNGISYRFGPSSSGSAISVAGGAQVYFGNTNGGTFEVTGRIDGGGGGSCLVLPEAAEHHIKGSIDASGAVRMGAGVYSISGYLHLGSGGGGSAFCQGKTISVEAIDTTFLIAGNGPIPTTWPCGGKAFCVSAGYDNIRITAPQSGPFTDMAVIGPLNPSRPQGAIFTAGGSGGQVSGAFYFPNGPVELSGAASASGGATGCFQLIGAQITLSGGSAVTSECRLPGGGGGGGRVVILQ